MCIQAHMNLKTIRARLGHSSIRVTGDRYAHLLQAVEERDMAASTTRPSLRKVRGRFVLVGDTGIESHSTLCAVMRLTSQNASDLRKQCPVSRVTTGQKSP